VHEVYAYGVIAQSTLCVLEGDFPSRAGYAEIVDVIESFGGEAVGSAYALARLGVAAKFDGNYLSDDPASRRIIRVLSDAGLDCSRIRLSDDAAAVREVVVSYPEARTVFGSYGMLLESGTWNEPSGDDIRASRIVCLDPFFGEQSEHAAEICVHAGVPFVSIDVAPGTEIARHAEVLILSEEYLLGAFGPVNRQEVLADYLVESTGLVVLTQGAGPVLFGGRGQRRDSIDPFPVEVRDTTGAGDAIRAGVIYGMLKGMETAEMIRTGCAVAGMVCEQSPGVMGSPTEAELDRFLDARA
jgi:sugar/nucleoside kinase (ribokinase family)